MLAAGLLAVSRVLQSPYGVDPTSSSVGEKPPERTLSLRATNEANLRQYCSQQQQHRHGCLSTSYETDHSVPPITDRAEFWR